MVLGLGEGDPRPLPLGGVGREQGAGLEPPLVFAELADVEDVARPQREPVHHHAVAGVRMLAPNLDVDLADPIPLPLGDVVDQVELARLLQEPGVGPDVGEHEAPAAVDVADHVQVGVHLRLVERLAPLELEIPLQELGLEPAVADERDVADLVAGPLVDHEGQVRPVADPLADHRHLPADAGLEEAQAPVVGSQGLDVGIDPLPVHVPPQKPEHARLRLDLGQEAGVAGDGVAHEARPQRLAGPALVDQEHRPFVARLASLDGRHPGRVVALLVVVALDPPAGLLHDVGIHGVADVDLRLLAKRPGREPLVADILDIPEGGPLHDLEDDDHPVAGPDILGVHVHELPGAVQRPHVVLDRPGVEDLPGAGEELGQPRDLDRLVAFDANLHDQVGRRRGGLRLDGVDRRQGGDPGGLVGPAGGCGGRHEGGQAEEARPGGAADEGSSGQHDGAGRRRGKPRTNSPRAPALTRRKVSVLRQWGRRRPAALIRRGCPDSDP